MYKITCVIPCWKRPQRTIRALESVIAQDLIGWEAIFVGDKCKDFENYLQTGVFDRYKSPGNSLIFYNLDIHYGGWGGGARKYGIDNSTGQYICFLDNDDILLPNHFSNFCSFMESNPEVDVGYFNARTEPWKKDRISAICRGGIGNAELCFKSEVLKKEYEIDLEYEHDWRLVERIKKKGYNIKKCNTPPTYIIMSVPNYRETGID